MLICLWNFDSARSVRTPSKSAGTIFNHRYQLTLNYMDGKTKTETLAELWKEARTRFSDQLLHLTQQDLTRKFNGTQNSIGFLIRHVGDVELLFAKNVFGADVQVKAKTLIAQRDTGEWTDLDELKSYVQFSAQALESSITGQIDHDWEKIITTKEFGSKTLAESLGRIISHTAHHGGQIALILKYAPSAEVSYP